MFWMVATSYYGNLVDTIFNLKCKECTDSKYSDSLILGVLGDHQQHQRPSYQSHYLSVYLQNTKQTILPDPGSQQVTSSLSQPAICLYNRPLITGCILGHRT